MNTQVHNSLVKRIWLTMAFILSCYKILAYDIVVDGLSYNKITENTVTLASVDTLYSGHLEIPEAIQFDGNTMKVTSISRRALENCKRITSVDLPNSIVEIEYRAFYNCINLQTVNLQSGITTFGYGVFENCYGLEQLTIPNTVISMGSDLFRDCRSLRSVSLPNQITKLPERLFLRCEKLNGIELPQSIQYIKASVFSGCKSLQEIVLPDNLISIGLYAFDGSGIKSIIIPNSVKTIDSYSFHNCENLSSVKLSESIIKISDFCFCGCSNLSSISLPKTITAIDEHAFQGCSTLNSINITENVESIGKYAFAECPNLSSVILPNSLKSIGGFCFYRTSKINVRSYIIKPFKVDITVFSGLDKDAVLYVPRGTKEEYQSVGGWGNFNIVEMEDYPDSFSLKIIVSGNGNVSYKQEALRNTTKTFTIEEGTNATITFTPDNGYRLKSVVVNNYNVTSSVSNNSYTISNIGRNTTVEVEFEAIPTTTYSLSIKATGNGSASYDGTTVRDKTSTFTVNEGTNARITFTPDNGYRIKSLVVNSADVTSYISSNAYTINNITKNTTLVVEFEAETTAFTISGVNYAITSSNEKSVSVSKGIYGDVLEIPATVTYQNTNWKVTGIESDALANSSDLCAIIWNPEAAFTESISNPNLLLYVKAASYAPNTIKNVIVNGTANSITLTDAESGNNFYCPQEFTAKSVSYTHHYKMETGMGEAKGWETIALPFDVQKVKHQSKDEIVMFANWNSGDSKKPFWLMQYGNSGWTDANSIKAYTPYIISMPNHTKYKEDYKLNGNVTFSAENVKIGKTENMSTSYSNGKTFIPNFALQTDKSYYPLNVNNDYIIYNGNIPKGSLFYPGLRDIHPFEAYMTTASGARSIAIADDMMTTGIRDIMEMYDEQKDARVYDLKGQLIKTEDCKSLDQVKKTLPAGVYIVNGQKVIIK